MAKMITIKDTTYAKLYKLKKDTAMENMAQGNYDGCNPSFDSVINDLLEK